MAQATFATAINCMDGRTQQPVTEWMKREFGVDFVDAITEPGADKALAQGPPGQVASIKNRVLISVDSHGSRNVAVVGHHDCAGNPVSKESHIEMTRKAVKVVASWGLSARVLGLWVGEDWQVEVIADTAP